jgi:hypothetical protein
MSTKHICLPLASEAQYREHVDNPAQYRQYLLPLLHQHPAPFPEAIDQGFTLHDYYVLVKQDLVVRRLKVTKRQEILILQ